jgi:hypothetical protein
VAKPSENFRVIGRLEGKYRIQWESGKQTLADDVTLATLREQHKEFTTNQLFPAEAELVASQGGDYGHAIGQLAKSVNELVSGLKVSASNSSVQDAINELSSKIEGISDRLKTLEAKSTK